ncbi:hypothetical protein O181_038636 [Austropuccinia psidii MF-1]|uniref:Aldehyde dehydrogenase domain-containing protein n=1 Tax=Austropuccinia psidii MF-1 TaxID=1389203 RepID=A0A9Q3DED1_9BASI|nr:hypothetical protein [Austropuccinia psidii MF-1]
MSANQSEREARLEFTPIDQIQKSYEKILQGHSTGLTKTYQWRIHQLKQLIYLLQENDVLLEETLTIDLGRPKKESQAEELIGLRKEAFFAYKNLKSWLTPQNVKTELVWLAAKPKVYHEPKGVVLIIGAWNYPLAVLLGPLIGAIAGGNSIILKPSENCPATSQLVTKLIQKYMDPNNICVINGAKEQNTTLLNLRFDHIFYTGGPVVAKIIALKAAETLTPITLELGGKSPAIIFDDANFPVTARRLVWAKTVNAGQTCIAPDYVLISKQNEQKFIKAIQAALKEFYPPTSQEVQNSKSESSSDPQTSQFCKIINRHHFDRLNNYLLKTGGEIVKLDLNSPIQPESADPTSLKVPFTLVRNLPDDDILMQEEIFGPILPIMTYDPEAQDAVQRLHQLDRSNPLTIYVFSQSEENFELVRTRTKSGQFMCNNLLFQYIIQGLPFGGIGTSGMGNYHGYHSFLTFTYERSVANVPFWTDFMLRSLYPPYTAFKLKFIEKLMAPKTLGGKSNPNPPIGTSSKKKKLLALDSSSLGRFSLKDLTKIAFGILIFWYPIRQARLTGQGVLVDSLKKVQQCFLLIKNAKIR